MVKGSGAQFVVLTKNTFPFALKITSMPDKVAEATEKRFEVIAGAQIVSFRKIGLPELVVSGTVPRPEVGIAVESAVWSGVEKEVILSNKSREGQM